MKGGKGADTFVFYASPAGDTNLATILDFQPGTDKLDLVGVDAVSGVSGNQAFSFIGEAGFSNHAGELRTDHSDPSKTVIWATSMATA